MKGNPTVIDALNEALSEEMTAINQYFLHGEMYENWGYTKLSAFIKKESIDEMKHAEKLIERILFLDGRPGMNNVKPLNIGQSIPEMIENDLKLELGAVAMYNRLIKVAGDAADQGTVELLKKLLQDEEGHVDGLEEQIGKVKDMGLAVYLSVQS